VSLSPQEVAQRQARAERLRRLCLPLLEHAKVLQAVTFDKQVVWEHEDEQARDERHEQALATSLQGARDVITQVEIEPDTDDIVDAFAAVVTTVDRYRRSQRTNGKYPATVSLADLNPAEAIPTAIQSLKGAIRAHLRALER
jgi:hypothetical protein